MKKQTTINNTQTKTNIHHNTHHHTPHIHQQPKTQHGYKPHTIIVYLYTKLRICRVLSQLRTNKCPILHAYLNDIDAEKNTPIQLRKTQHATYGQEIVESPCLCEESAG